MGVSLYGLRASRIAANCPKNLFQGAPTFFISSE